MSFLRRRPEPLPTFSPLPEGVQEFRHEFPGIEPVLRWCIPNSMRGYAPVLAQGFPLLEVLDADPDRSLSGAERERYRGDYEFPDARIQYSTSLKYTYETLEEARAKALSDLSEARAKLNAATAEVMAVKDPTAPAPGIPDLGGDYCECCDPDVKWCLRRNR
jgi:hypothetical protein